MQAFFLFFKQRLYIFSLKMSNENKQRLYEIQKRPTSLFYHVLLIKQNECTRLKNFCKSCSVFTKTRPNRVCRSNDLIKIDYFGTPTISNLEQESIFVLLKMSSESVKHGVFKKKKNIGI